jgi:hypothetical protein
MILLHYFAAFIVSYWVHGMNFFFLIGLLLHLQYFFTLTAENRQIHILAMQRTITKVKKPVEFLVLPNNYSFRKKLKFNFVTQSI